MSEKELLYLEDALGHEQFLMTQCTECAAKLKGESFSLPGFGSHLLDGLFGLSASPAAEPQKSCPQCNATWADLRRAGKAFCPACYIAFREELRPSLRSLHGSNVTHTGRAPADRRARQEKRERLESLKKQLAEAISTENFEGAATLRDEIRALEQQ